MLETLPKYEFHAPPRTTDVMILGGNLIVDGPKVNLKSISYYNFM